MTLAMTQQAQPQTWTIEAVLRWATDDFRSRGIEKPLLDAQVLLAHALSVTRTQLVIDGKKPLAPEELAKFREMVKRRRAHEPVAYVLGVREFYGRPFRVDARVLVPRPDTEALVDVALARTADRSMSMRALDLCTGSGCVAITLARQRPTARVHATDLSDGALAVARENALRLGAYNVSFSQGDLFAAVPAALGSFDVITANPPYIPSGDVPGLSRDIRDHEPHLALDGGADGLDFVRRIVAVAPERLAPGGLLALEVGAGEAPAAARAFAERGLLNVSVTRDYGGIERVVEGRRA
jgi:release factor glutamine methyltransferase